MVKSCVGTNILLFPQHCYFAANNEQLAVTLLAIYLTFTIYIYINTRKVSMYLIFQSVLCLTNIVFALTGPGNQVRLASEIQSYMPQFADFSLFFKLYLGFCTTMHHVLIRDNIIFLTFCTLLAAVVFIKHNKWLYRSISAVPIVISLFLSKYLPGNPVYLHGNEEYLSGPDNIITLLYIFAFAIAIVCVILSVWFAFGKSKNFLLIVFIIGLGTMSRVMMGFSPSLYASDTRTFAFLWISLIYCIMIIINELEAHLPKKATGNIIFVLLIAIALSSNISEILRRVQGALI